MIKKPLKKPKQFSFEADIRKKMGLSQDQLSTIFGISRTHIAMIESGKRNLKTGSNSLLMNMYMQFHELETGKQLANRSVETNLFLNDEYIKVLPKMERLEKACRYNLKGLKEELAAMKERARDAENAIIVFSSTISEMEKNLSIPADENQVGKIDLMKLLKQQAYDHLLTCWEPEQAKLHARIEAVAGEAKALRRYRVKVRRAHNPEKIKRYSK